MLSSVEIAALKGGTAYDLIYANVDVLYSVTYNRINWSEGISVGMSTGDQLKSESAGVTGATWEVAVPVGPLADVIDAGVHLTYEGAGVTMDYSFDGSVWVAAENRRTILEGTDLANDMLFVRLTLINDESYVDSLTVDVLRDRTMTPHTGVRELVFSNTAMDQIPAHQATLGAEDGANIELGGYLEILPDVSEFPVDTIHVEFWAKKNSTHNAALFGLAGTSTLLRIDNNLVFVSAALTVKINGTTAVSETTTINLGEWNFYQITFGTPNNVRYRIGAKLDGTNQGEFNVYGLSLYSEIPTNTYQANIAQVGTRIDDTSVIALTERAPAVDIYAYTWTNSGM